MSCRIETVDDWNYRYCPEELPAVADRLRAIMQGRFVDELTGNPVRARLEVSSELTGIDTRASADAVGGLITNPARRFPGLAANFVTLDMQVSCRRFLTQRFEAHLGPFNTGLGFPDDFPRYFEPIHLGDIGLHRAATLINGRCMHNGGITRTPLVNASIGLSGIWFSFPAADVDPISVMQPPNIVALQQGLYRERHVGTDQVRRRSLTPQLDEKTLLLPAQAGSRVLRLSDRINLNVGDVLGIEIHHAEKVEYIEVTAIDGASTPDQPASVTLAYPLHQDHRDGVEAVVMNQPAGGSLNQFIRDGIVGDQILFLDVLNDIDNTVLEISGAGSSEYHSAHLYDVNSDNDGFYRLPPLSRVAMMRLTASHPMAAENVDLTFSPDYEQLGNRADLVFD